MLVMGRGWGGEMSWGSAFLFLPTVEEEEVTSPVPSLY